MLPYLIFIILVRLISSQTIDCNTNTPECYDYIRLYSALHNFIVCGVSNCYCRQQAYYHLSNIQTHLDATETLKLEFMKKININECEKKYYNFDKLYNIKNNTYILIVAPVRKKYSNTADIYCYTTDDVSALSKKGEKCKLVIEAKKYLVLTNINNFDTSIELNEIEITQVNISVYLLSICLIIFMVISCCVWVEMLSIIVVIFLRFKKK